MSISQLEIKQSIECSAITPTFDVNTCPPKFRDIFQQALSSKSGFLNLRDQGIDSEEVLHHIVPFLNVHPHITILDISSNDIDSEGAQALACNTTLTTLNLNHNSIGTQGAQALANNTTLTVLSLNKNNIGDEGAQALAKNKTLTTLNIHQNNIGHAGAEALAVNTSLTTLSINDNHVGIKGAQLLASNTALITLNINSNSILDLGAQALANTTTLRTLDISGNNIGFQGAKNFAYNTTLTHLNISSNSIGDANAQALMNNKTLTTLDIRYNTNISLSCAQTLMQHQQHRIEFFKNQKLAFLMKSQDEQFPVQTMSDQWYFEPKIFHEVFGFMKTPLNLLHSFAPEIMNPLSSCEHNLLSPPLSSSTTCSTAHEVKETAEEFERTDQKCLKRANVLCRLSPQDAEIVTLVFGSTFSLSTPFFGITDDNEMKVSREAEKQRSR